jgi:uncharacterized protein (TIGR00266 family)
MAQFEVLTQNNVNFVEIMLDNETVKAESGAMRYMLGDIEMVSKMPGIGGFLKATVTGETIFRPTYTGTGKLVLEPSLRDFYELELAGETLILDQGAYWASDGAVEISAKRNKLMSGTVSGEGLFQTSASGHGSVIICSPGPIEAIDMVNDRLVVDGSFAVARTDSLKFSVQKSSKGLIGSMTSGEGLVNVLEGSGRVYLAPIPNQNVVMEEVMRSAVYGMTRK